MIRPLPRFTLFPYTTLFRSRGGARDDLVASGGSELGIDVPVGAMHGETHRPDGADPEPGLACAPQARERSEEHTSELQSHSDLVCRLLLEKKKRKMTHKS